MKKCILTQNIAQMSPESGAYWSRTRSEFQYGGVPLEDIAPPGPKREAAIRSTLDGLHVVGGWIDASGEEGSFLMGKEPCFADADVAASLRWLQLMSGKEEDGLWAAVAKLDGGRWATYAKEFEKWEACP